MLAGAGNGHLTARLRLSVGIAVPLIQQGLLHLVERGSAAWPASGRQSTPRDAAPPPGRRPSSAGGRRSSGCPPSSRWRAPPRPRSSPPAGDSTGSPASRFHGISCFPSLCWSSGFWFCSLSEGSTGVFGVSGLSTFSLGVGCAGFLILAAAPQHQYQHHSQYRQHQQAQQQLPPTHLRLPPPIPLRPQLTALLGV